MFLKVLICSLFCCTLTFADGKRLFSSDWDDYPQCKGPNQSPIKIESSDATYDAVKANVTFDFEREQINENVTFENDGETVFLWSENFGESLTLDGSKFYLRLVNYHWGCAEHRLDDEHFNGEVEVLFAKEGAGNLTQAMQTPGGAVAISVLLKKNEQIKTDIPELGLFLNMTERLRDAGSKVEDVFRDGVLSLGRLINMTELYYRYTGSLTVTPCTANLERFVLHKPIQVTPGFFEDLGKCKNVKGEPMEKSIQRTVQSLGSRIVYKSKE